MKRKLSLLVIAFLSFVPLAHATKIVATLGDKNSVNAYRISVNNAGTVAYATDDSMIFPDTVLVHTTYSNSKFADYILSTTDSGKVIVDMGGQPYGTSGQGGRFVLPECDSNARGTKFKIVSGNKAVTVTVDVWSTNDDSINNCPSGGACNGPGDSVKSVATNSGSDNATFQCTGSHNWIITDKSALWTNNTTN